MRGKPLVVLAMLVLVVTACVKEVPYEELDTPLEPVNRVEAEYPKEAQEAGIEGSVIVRARVKPDGEVTGQVAIKESSNNELLNKAAIEAAKLWKFTPPLKNGKGVLTSIEIPFHFKLESQWVAFEDLDKKPEPVESALPEYPTQAKKQGIEAKIEIKALVDAEGKVAEVQLVESSGNEMLDKAALDGVSKWTFTPAEKTGEKVATWVTVPVHFKSE